MFAFQIFDMASTMIQRIRQRRVDRRLKEELLKEVNQDGKEIQTDPLQDS